MHHQHSEPWGKWGTLGSLRLPLLDEETGEEEIFPVGDVANGG